MIMWDSASLMPGMIGALKAEANVVASAGIMDQAYFKRASISILHIRVSIGGFRNIERDSTLMFMDFVLSNVVSLLIMQLYQSTSLFILTLIATT